MTIAKTTSRVAYAGNDSTTAFAYGYRFFADGDLQVYILVDSTGVQTLQTLTTHYTVSNNGDETGGTVTMVTAPATGETLTLLRAVPQTQSTDYAANDAFPAESHEAALDRLTLQGQEVSERTDRALVGQSSDGDMAALPSIVDRVSSYFGWDASGDPVVLSAPTDTSITTVWSRDLLDDGNAFSGRDTLLVSDKVLVKSANYTLTAADRGKVIVFTATATLSLLTAASAQDGYSCTIIVEGGILTIDPSGSETCNGVTTSKMYSGEEGKLFTDATEWRVGGLGSGPVVIETITPSAGVDSEIEFTNVDGDRFRHYTMEPNNLHGPSSEDFQLRFSSDGGSTWVSTSTYYSGLSDLRASTGASAEGYSYDIASTSIPVIPGTLATDAEYCSGQVRVSNFHEAAHTLLESQLRYTAGSEEGLANVTGRHAGATAMNAIQILVATGTWSGGSVTLIGHP